MEMVQNFKVLHEKFNVLEICNSGNYTQKWIFNCIDINS